MSIRSLPTARENSASECFLCAGEGPRATGRSFVSLGPAEVEAMVLLRPHHAGHPGMAHGGDEPLWCCRRDGSSATVRTLRTLPHHRGKQSFGHADSRFTPPNRPIAGKYARLSGGWSAGNLPDIYGLTALGTHRSWPLTNRKDPAQGRSGNEFQLILVSAV